ncbi:MAG: Ig-like domain-containing protein [Pirellulaceae bacterium]|nr:Ig-like domain-containing protein [Pirellulaceae bacterium]
MLDGIELDSFEDAPDQQIDLNAYFSADQSSGQADYSLESQSGDMLIDEIVIDEEGWLKLSFADNQHGQAGLILQSLDSVGNIEKLPVLINLESTNDAPTTTGILDISVAPDVSQTVINLHAAFDDVEDGSSGLTYQVTANSNADLFDAIRINQEQGSLILEHASGQTGFADVTVVATDSGGLSVGMATSEDFAVYNKIFGRNGTSPDTTELGLKPIDLWTGWRFWERVNGAYATDELSTEKFTRFLTNPEYTDPTHQHVFNIETSDHVNTAEGRDNFAELLGFAKEVNPDLEIGVYRIMPERIWTAPVVVQRGMDEAAKGLSTFASQNYGYFEQSIQNWHARNELFRTEPVSAEFGGGTVAELIDTVNPSLYTLSLDFMEYFRGAELDAVSNTLVVDAKGPTFDDVERVKLEIAVDAELNNGLETGIEYYVINVDGRSFQLSTTPDGNPIDFDDDFSGRIYAAATGDLQYTFHDSNVRYWHTYAETNIAEARKFGKPVNAWISPSVSGLGIEQFSYDFFRWQLEVLRPLVDGVTVYQWPSFEGSFYVQQAWWQALDDFMDTTDQSANEFRITVAETPLENQAPVARVDSLAAVEDSPISWQVNELLRNDLDAESDQLELANFSQPEHGTLVRQANGSLLYQADDNYFGQDMFWYRATDGNGVSNAAWARIDVRSVNDRPVAIADQLTTGQSETLFLGPYRLLPNDFDVDGDTLQVRLSEGPSHGTLKQNAKGFLIYTPDAEFVGRDEFQYQVSDGIALSSSATVIVDVTADNSAPVAVSDRIVIEEDQPMFFQPDRLLSNDQDSDGDPLTIQIASLPAHGTVTHRDDGRWLYTPEGDYHGTDEFYYRALDGKSKSNLAKVSLVVQPINDNPIAVSDELTTTEDTRLIFADHRLLANDLDVDSQSLRVVLVDSPTHGVLRRNLNEAFVYTPALNFHGLDQFTYRISDGEGQSNPVAVQIQVVSENDAPIASVDDYQVSADQILTVGANTGALSNDRDPENDSLSARLYHGPSHGKVTLDSTGSFSYEPDAGFQGIDTFRYVAFDRSGGGSIGAVRIRVTAAESVEVDDSPLEEISAVSQGTGSRFNQRIEALLRQMSLPSSRSGR